MGGGNERLVPVFARSSCAARHGVGIPAEGRVRRQARENPRACPRRAGSARRKRYWGGVQGHGLALRQVGPRTQELGAWIAAQCKCQAEGHGPTCLLLLPRRKRLHLTAKAPQPSVMYLEAGQGPLPVPWSDTRACCRLCCPRLCIRHKTMLRTRVVITPWLAVRCCSRSRSYGAEQGQGALREAVAGTFYSGLRTADEIFISDGSKCDIARIQMMFGNKPTVAVQVREAEGGGTGEEGRAGGLYRRGGGVKVHTGRVGEGAGGEEGTTC